MHHWLASKVAWLEKVVGELTGPWQLKYCDCSLEQLTFSFLSAIQSYLRVDCALIENNSTNN